MPDQKNVGLQEGSSSNDGGGSRVRRWLAYKNTYASRRVSDVLNIFADELLAPLGIPPVPPERLAIDPRPDNLLTSRRVRVCHRVSE